MAHFTHKCANAFAAMICLIGLNSYSLAGDVHTWEKIGITLTAENSYQNPYTQVQVWAELTGPNFNKKVYGFWDGGKTFRIRLMATEPGKWTWKTFSNPQDAGLADKKGDFKAINWTDSEKQANPNRRGTIRPTTNGRALQYAEGTPFFLLCDTHWSAGTWRYPFKGVDPSPDYKPSAGMGFEELIHILRQKGFNSIGMISCFPNWDHDGYGKSLKDDSGVEIRSAWPKPGDQGKAMDMHDENGNRPFMMPGKCNGKSDACADFDSINPAYWQNLDRKMDYMSANGFVPYFESVRRDHFASWIAYYNFDESFGRFLNYLAARYGTNNMIFSLFHGDYMGKSNWIKPLDRAVDLYYEKYGPMPFGQPTTAMASKSTLYYFGHSDKSPWLKIHTSGNLYRNHLIYEWIEKQFDQTPPEPIFNNECYYVGFKNPGALEGPLPEINSELDNYYGRSMMYGNVLSGALAGHVYGSLAWPGVTTGEPEYSGQEARRGMNFWKCLDFAAHGQMQFLGKFILSEGTKYRDLLPASDDLSPRKSSGSKDVDLKGWAYMMRTKDKSLALLYFEINCQRAVISNMSLNKTYQAQWYDPRNGVWSDIGNGKLTADDNGDITMPDFPSNKDRSDKDWAVKLKAIE